MNSYKDQNIIEDIEEEFKEVFYHYTNLEILEDIALFISKKIHKKNILILFKTDYEASEFNKLVASKIKKNLFSNFLSFFLGGKIIIRKLSIEYFLCGSLKCRSAKIDVAKGFNFDLIFIYNSIEIENLSIIIESLAKDTEKIVYLNHL